VVRRSADAGAVLLGKHNLHELAFGVTTNNPHTGTTRNPKDPSRIPGGGAGYPGEQGSYVMDKVDLAEKLAGLDEPFRPGIVGYLNDYKLVVVKVHGAFVWHKHDDTDDFFLVLRGRITIQLRDRDVELREGELFVVPRGVEHCPKADEEAHVLLIEPRGTANTGDAGGDLTAEEMEI
jgi:mannose-6-phosphate isomerase-like protein (cupin superfamily)